MSKNSDTVAKIRQLLCNVPVRELFIVHHKIGIMQALASFSEVTKHFHLKHFFNYWINFYNDDTS
jgi:hypothetical protein